MFEEEYDDVNLPEIPFDQKKEDKKKTPGKGIAKLAAFFFTWGVAIMAAIIAAVFFWALL